MPIAPTPPTKYAVLTLLAVAGLAVAAALDGALEAREVANRKLTAASAMRDQAVTQLARQILPYEETPWAELEAQRLEIDRRYQQEKAQITAERGQAMALSASTSFQLGAPGALFVALFALVRVRALQTRIQV
jgi:hypothetical protein